MTSFHVTSRMVFTFTTVLFATAFAIFHFTTGGALEPSLFALGSGALVGVAAVGLELFIRLGTPQIVLSSLVGVVASAALTTLLFYWTLPVQPLLILGFLALSSTTFALATYYILTKKFQPPKSTTSHKSIVVDVSTLQDPRFFDLVTSGLVDTTLILSKPLLDEHVAARVSDGDKNKIQEILEKIEALPSVNLVYDATPLSANTEPAQALLLLAEKYQANILTTGTTRVFSDEASPTRVISLQKLSAALRPLMQMGETLKIKVQRQGKEERQGVGYLEDGTMVVINGGGDFIGEVINTHVLSVKHTSSGRMVFCNAQDEELYEHQTTSA